ncbi:MAG: baseplate J/gp47 family protein [Chryseobacterium sp.]
MEAPEFINIDPETIIGDIKSDYEQMTGRTLYPGQIEQLLINSFAYREVLIRTQIQNAATQNLVAFSSAPFLDFLGDLVGVKRLAPSKSFVQVKMKFTTGHGLITIPKGIRIQSNESGVVFSLIDDVVIQANEDEKTVSFVSVNTGVQSNGFNPGEISIILDPQAYLYSVVNTSVSDGGSDEESDQALRERIILAPQSFSNAGSRGAYDFFARSANAGIIDVGITSPVPGQVNIYPLMKDGELPSQGILDEVKMACNDEKVRPLTDTVIVQSPSVKGYEIDADLTLITGALSSEVMTLVNDKLINYANSRKMKTGLDVVIEKIIGEAMKVDSVYDVKVNLPLTSILVGEDEVAICSAVNVKITGYSDE